ncbi:ATP-dependent DNA helicase Q-like 5 [Rutidosis leptorrhynchoides]|uniref:ATP-dependent DNA helicase Q-like 5 n=1 Tax=Rutidosis leptorrhynchoides TaxID=125765 RepID=UPI003A9937D2
MNYSDSDSDGSHISSTPPRQPYQPPPPPPPPPEPRHTLPDFNFKNPKLKPGNAFSRPILKTKPSTKRTKPPPPKFEPRVDGSDPFESPVPSTTSSSDINLPFQIRRLSGRDSIEFVGPAETLVAGRSCLSKAFSKMCKPCLNLESTEDRIDHSLAAKVVDVNVNANSADSEQMKDCDRVNVVNETLGGTNLGKVMRKNLNLIGSSVLPTVQATKPKPVNEGNFVRLNINGHGGRKKFAYKVRKRNQNAYTGNRKSYKRSKRKLKTGGEGEEERSLCEEESLRFEENENADTRLDFEVIEQAVSDVRRDPCDENLVKLLKLTHGYDSFRDGQLEAIKFILDGKSSMVILPTGAGKSLCYQLPAIVLQGMTLVISPLVALMFDQLKQLPPVIPGGLLCSSQTLEESSETLRRVQEGALKVLFVSPERLLNAEFTSIFSANSLISLVVIDEAHCISEWSHNFRPSYMRLRASLLRSSLGVECILAMTATATTKTMNDVMCSLEIPHTNLIQTEQIRDNLQLSVSLSGHRMKDLMSLLKAPPYTDVKSIIIYCKYQSETDMISKFLGDSNIRAKSYHGGIPAKDRRRAQELFCSNKIRVIVATVAFGMGLDKSDVGAVIHYSLPESLEEYVQEIGRAGRDGRLSYCHLFFDDTTYFKLRSLMYSEGLDQYTVNKFLSQIFIGSSLSQGRICSLVKESASRKFDMKEEVILTILTRLELAEVQYLRLLPQSNVTCVLNFHMTSPALLAAKDTVIAAILNKSEIKDGQYVFDIPNVACSIGIQPFNVTNQLQILKSKGEITYELKDPAYCYMIVNFPKDICSLAADLAKWLSEVESCKVRKVDAMYNAALFAVKTCDKKNGCIDSQHTTCLQKKILDYFNADNDNDNIANKMDQTSRFLRADIKVFLQSNSHTKFSPRAIARIMHGIASPAFPSSTWSRTHFWGRYIQTNFDVIMEAAKAELMDSAGKYGL